MLAKLREEITRIRSNKRLEPILDTALFAIITLVIHFSYRYWERASFFSILGVQILTPGLFEWFTQLVFEHTRAVLNILLPVSTSERTFYFLNECSVTIVWSCSGIKQMLQTILLFALFPGPWKHKAWFIPMSVVVIHITNVLRLAGLGIVMANWPQHWQWSHDYPFRIVFYVVIFFLWVIWNERFHHSKSKSKAETKA